MNLKKQKQITVSKSTMCILILIVLSVKTAFSDPMFNLEDELLSPDNELDLSIDLTQRLWTESP